LLSERLTNYVPVRSVAITGKVIKLPVGHRAFRVEHKIVNLTSESVKLVDESFNPAA
jgi:hypothetical protein